MPIFSLDTLTTVFLFVCGTLLGSFLNVVALRYDPDAFVLHRSVVRGRSHCPHCRRMLRWFELVPLLSFLVQRGKCRTCHAALSFQYPLVELLAGLIVLFVPGQVAAIFTRFAGFGGYELLLLQVVWVLAFLTLLLMSAIDFRLRLIPDELNVLLAFLGIVGIALTSNFFGQVEGSFLGHYAALFGVRGNAWLNHAFGFLVAGGFFGLVVLLTRGRAMGLGDVKLAAALGILFGWPDVAAITMFAFILGALIGIVALALRKKTMKSFVAFGPFLAIGAVFVFFFGLPFFRWYFSLLEGIL